MKTPRSRHFAQKLSARTRFVIAITTFSLLVSMFGVNAFMQGQKKPVIVETPTIMQVDRAGVADSKARPSGEVKEAGASVAETQESASAALGVDRNQAPTNPSRTPERPLVVGTCDTAGPIEVESSGGTAAGVPTAYATLALAFTAINGGTIHTGTITIDVCGNTTETGTAGLNQVAGVTSVTISPAGGAARTISGAIAAGSPLINLNGADNVTINGLNTGGNSLTISNTTVSATAGTSTIQFVADATNNTVTNCSIQSSSTVGVGTSLGGAVVFGTGTTTGNDNNTISNNNIGPAGTNLPVKLITGSGSTTNATIQNSGIIINNNNIFDFFGTGGVSVTGIDVRTGNETWTISNNRIYQTAARTFTTSALRYAGITISSASFSSSAYTVTGNTIGFGAANGTGTTTISGSSNEFRGLDIISVSTTVATSIQGNTISGINQTSSRASTSSSSSNFIAIAIGVTGGLFNVGNVTGNTIGSLDASSSIVIAETSTTASTAPVIGIFDFSFTNSNISNNRVGTVTINSGGSGTTVGFRGILISGTTGQSVTINSNVIGGTAAGSITDNIVGSYALYGIQSASANISATGNTVRNMSGASNGASLIISAGILASGATGNNTISQNTIHSLSNASGAAANSIYGMSLSLPATTNLIERNLIHSFSLTSTVTGTQLWGISAGATGTATYQNNMIRLGYDAAGNSITLPTSMIGIRDASGSTNQYYHNTIYIGGTGVLATPTASNSYCFFSDVVTVTRNHQDNVFWNARSNAAGGGVAHIVTREGGTTANPAGLTSNYNILYFSGTDGATGVFNGVVVSPLSAWRTATGQDANSIAADPQLIAPNGTAATVDLHIHPTNPTPIEGAGLAIGTVTNDYDGQSRAGLTPTDIGADAGNFVALDVSAPVISYTPLGNTASTSNRTLMTTITDATGVPTSGTGLPVLYYRKGTSGTFASSQASFGGGSTYNFTIDYSQVAGGSVMGGDTIQYYVVAQDTASPPNVGANPAVGASGFTANPPAASTPPTTPNSYSILASISGGKTVCSSGCDYATLTAAIAALNNSVITGPVTFTLSDFTYSTATGETFPLTINANGGSSSTNTVTIKPGPGVSPTIFGSSASAVFVLNGADWVTIDGTNAGSLTAVAATRDLTINNSNTGTSSAVVWLQSAGSDGATNNTIKNVVAVGNSNTTTLIGIGSGSSTISITSTGTGNNSNTIQNCDISKTQYGIYSGGASAANKNTGNIITQNSINAVSPNNVATGGILANFENGIQITQNDIGNLLKHDGTTGTTGTVFGIALGVVPSNTVTTFTGSDVTGATVTRNKINALTQLNSTGYSSFGIIVNSVTSGTTLVANNMISQVRSASTASDFSAGIVAGGGTGSTTQIYFNSVSMTGSRNAATFPSYGLAIGSGDPIIDVRDNIFFNTQTSTSTGKMYAIGTGSATFANLTSNYNDLFVSGTSGFIGQTGGLGTSGTDRATLANWQTATGKDANSISANPQFTSTSDLHLNRTIPATPSPVEDVGTPIGSITNDFDNDTRNATGPDIGADETNNPGQITFTSALPSVSVNENAGTLNLSVSRINGSDGAVSVQYATADGTATAGADYTATSGTLNWAHGDAANKNIAIPINDDMIYEDNETFTVTLSMPTGGATLGVSMKTVTINDNDNAPSLSINDVTMNEGNSGTTNFVFTVTKTGATAFTTTVNYQTSDVSATTADGDYTATNGTLTFMPADTTKTITVSVNGDMKYEGDDLFNVVLSGATNAIITDNVGDGTIQNDDSQPSFSIDDVTHMEGNSGTTSYVFTVTKTGATAFNSSVQFQTNDGTATLADSDYQNNTGTLTFLPADTTMQITVLVNGDTTAESDETFTVQLFGAGGATISDDTGTGTIQNDDTANTNPTISDIADQSVSQDNYITVPFTVGDAETPAANLTLTGASNNQTLVPDANITFGGSGANRTVTVTPAAGQTGMATITVTVHDTDTGTASDQFVLTVNPVTCYGPPASLISWWSAENNANDIYGTNNGTLQGSATYASGKVGQAFSFNGPGQYVQVPHNANQNTGAQITVDAWIRPTNLIATNNASIINKRTGGNVEGYTFELTHSSSGLYFEMTTGDGIFAVTANNVLSTNVWQHVAATYDGSSMKIYVNGSQVASNAASGTINAVAADLVIGKNIFNDTSFPGQIDEVELFNSALTGMDINGIYSASMAGKCHTSTLQLSSAAYNLDENDGNATITVTRTGAHDSGASVAYATSDGTATGGASCGAGVDYQTSTGMLSFAAGDVSKTFNVPVCDDLIFEGNETVNLALSNQMGTGVTLGTPSAATLTINDNEGVPSLSIDDVTFTGVDSVVGGGSGSFTVTLSHASTQTVMVHYATSDDTATAGEDYTAVSGTLTFMPGDTSKSIPITILSDNVNEPTEDFFVDLDNAMNATIGDGHGVGTIPNDDPQPTISIDDHTFTGVDSLTASGFTVTLSNPSSSTITVHYATSDDTATAGEDYTAASGTLTFMPGDTSKPIPITILGDNVNEPDETFFVDLDTPTNATILDGHGVGTITNDDAVPSISIGDVTKVEGDSGTSNVTFTVTLSNPSSQSVSAQFTTMNGTATAGSDYTLTAGSVTFNPLQTTQTIAVAVAGDIKDEANETFSVVLSNPMGATLGTATGVGTIIDDDLNTGDFDGDGKNDLAVFRPNADDTHTAKWYVLNSVDDSITEQQFGAETDIPVAGDYNGDGQKEIAVFRPSEGAWYISHGSAQNFLRVQWGQNGDVPVPADYDGDGKTDLAVFRPGDDHWYVLKSSDNQLLVMQWGLPTDKLAPADYDGDGKADFAVFRKDDPVPGGGTWYILRSSDNGFSAQQWGASDDKLVPADYDRDGKADVAVWRPSDGTFYVRRSSDGGLQAAQWGLMGDVPVVGDYDNDGKADYAVWRPSMGIHYILRSSDGDFIGPQWGASTDVPVASRYIPEQ